MKELIERFASTERAISDSREGFWLFALFLREDALDRWDLVVSAPWTQHDSGPALRYLAEQVNREFNPEELKVLSRIVLVDKGNPALEAINRAMHVEHGVLEVRDSTFFGLSIKHAYVITSKSPSIPASVPVA